MFKFFKEKCPICKMELKEEKDYVEEFGKKFCSNECRETFRKKMVKEQSKFSKGRYH